ncbi:MAG: patatin-like phospholipase family protein [Candidatus Paceibacterota bacterium]
MAEEKKDERKELALVLSGGSARGMAHIGVIKTLEKNNISPNIVIGTSAGAMIGGMYAAGSLEAFEKTMLSKSKKQLNRLLQVWPSREGLINTKRIEKEFRLLIDEKKIENLDKKFMAVAVDLVSGKKIVFDKGDLCEAILASTAIPLMFPPVHKEEMLLVDGGIQDPLAIDIGFQYAKKVIAVNITTQSIMQKKDKYNYVDILQRALAIVESDIITEEIKKYKENLFVLDLAVDIPILDFSRAKEAIDVGEKETKKHTDEIKELLKRK